MQGRILRTAKATAAGLVVAGVVCAGAVVPAYAEPTTVEQARAELDAVHEEAGRLEEEWAQASIRLDEGRARLDALTTDISYQQNQVDTLAGKARQVALIQFQSRDIDTTAALFVSGDPDSFMQGLSTTQKVNENLNAVMQQYQQQYANLTDLKRSAEAEVAALAAEETRMADLDAQAKTRERAASRTLERLTAAERAAVHATENSGVVDATALVAPAASGSADSRALQAVAYAMSKVGKTQYVWGAAGPNSFDCSGLTLAAYASAGVSLPHSSLSQSQMGTAVSQANLKPGDLLFWYSPVHHVGIYVGNGNFVHARNTSVDIVMQPLSSYPAPYSGARRIVG